jgi:hypothetical protein
MEFFGFTFGGKKAKTAVEQVIPSVIDPEMDDGTQAVSSSAGYYGYYVDMDGTVKDEVQAIRRYREVSLFPDVDIAIQDIVNEAIPYEDDSPLVELVSDRLETSDAIKEKINDEFKYILRLLKFNEKAPDLFKKWYVDGRLYHNVLVDKNPNNGIVEIRPIEATKIKKVRELIKDKTPEGVEIIKGVKEYYVYSQNGFVAQTNTATPQAATTAQGVKLTDDSVIFTPSGFVDMNTGAVLSYLSKALRAANQLRMLEDAVVIYRLSRAPERRIFYVDVGNLPKAKAEQYVKDIMNRYRNKLVYDAKTGEVRDDKKYMSMLEDFWMPRRDGGKGTEITTLPGGQNLGELTDIEYFQNKLYMALNIPVSRLQPEQGFSLGRSTEISRDEVKFQKFIGKIRRKFSELFYDLLKMQLLLKGIINDDDWEEIKELITFRFQKDNFFSELKNQDLMMARLQVAQMADMYIGKYFSVEQLRRNLFQMSDDEIEELDKQMDAEKEEHPEWYAQLAAFEQQQEMAQQQAEMGMQQQEMGAYQDQQNQQQQNQNQGA